MGVRILVMYDHGSVTLPEIITGVEGLGELVFGVAEPASEHVALVLPLLADLGTVVGVGDLLDGAVPAPDGVVTFCERMLPHAVAVAERYGLPSPGPVALLTDKYRQRRRLAERGVDAVACRMISDPGQWAAAVSEIGLPVVVKPARGEKSRNTFRVDDAEAGRRLVQEVFAAGEDALVVEELLVGRGSGAYGDYVSVESVTCAGLTGHMTVTGKLPLASPFREVGQFWPDHLAADERAAVLDLVTAALSALEVDYAITHTEVKLTPEGPRIIEVNGRIGGHINDLSVRGTGVDLVRVAVQVALGGPAPAVLPRPDAVVFQHNELPPTSPVRLAAVDGSAAVRAHPNVDRHRLFARVGDVVGDVSTAELDMIYGRALGHDEMFAAVSELRRLLTFRFEPCGADGRGGRQGTL